MFELTNPQKSIWMMEQFYNGTNINNICATLTINRDVDIEKLNRAINIFIQNNESFGLNFKIENGEIKQYFTEFKYIEFECFKLKDKLEVNKLAKETAEELFDVEGEKLFIFKLYKLENGNGGFVVMTHHLISDAATMSIVGKEVIEIYYKLISEEEIEEKEYTYRQYIEDEKEYLQSTKFIKDKEYWNKNFVTVPEVATIPSVLEKTNIDLRGKAERKEFILNDELVTKISQFCNKNKISNFNFFMAVYAIYLSRVSNLKDFVIGTPILNRTNFKEKHTTGMFINTAPLRIQIDENIDFMSLVKNIAQSSMSMLRYQKYSYQKLLEDLRERDNNIPTLYDVMLSYQVTKANDRTSKIPYEVEWIPSTTISNPIYIHLHDNDDDGQLNVAYDYQIEKYTKQDMLNMHNRILHIIEQVLKDVNLLEKDIEIVTPEEKYQILNVFNDTHTEYPRDKTIVDLFEEQVEKTPDNIAVVCGEEKITYKELNEKANSLARYLLKHGAKSNTTVGVLINRSLEMIIGILAIVKSGATYIPIDVSYPEKRIKYILENSHAEILLTNKKSEKLSLNKCKKIIVDFEGEKFKNEPKSNLNKEIKGEDNLYIIYTSGSTGNPKGVVVTHRNMQNFVYAMGRNIDFNSNKTMISVTTISFDIFALELYCSLLNGMKLVVANEEEQINSKLLKTVCIKNNVSIIQTTPSRITALIEDEESIDYFKNFTEVLVGGEGFPKALLERLKKITKAKIYNMYGPTETTVWSTMKKIDNKITIGKPVANTTCYILDGNMELLPINTPGCLYIGGEGVSNGYFKNQNLTSEKFVEFKYSKGKIYNTNDLAYWNENGELIHLGRLDFQIKLNGYRIDLAEIEESILNYPEVSNCAVIQVSAENNKKYLCAYIVAKTKIDEEKLRKALFEELPTYMVPSKIIQIENMVYTPNGKIDRKSLPVPKFTEEQEKREPKTKKEKEVLKIVKQVLKNEKIGVEDYLFDNGGDSLIALTLAIKLSNEFNTTITIKDIYENFTIRKLAKYMENSTSKRKYENIKPIEDKDTYNTSFAQQRIYYASQVGENNSTLYNISGGVILNTIPNIEKLEKTINILIRKHSALRTYFELQDGKLMQKINSSYNFKLKVKQEETDDIEKIFTSFVKPFELLKANLFRFELAITKSKKAFLMLDMHHSISDGTSLNILLSDLGKIYNGEEQGKETIEYKDFAEWEHERIQKNEFEKAEKYWIEQFKDEIPSLNIPTIHKRNNKESHIGTREYKKIDLKLVEKINQIASKLNCTAYMVFLAAYYILLYIYTEQKDIIVGTSISGRYLPEIENLVGMFVNTLALRSKINPKSTFEQYLENIKSMCLSAYDNQEYPSELINEKLNIQREDGKRRLFDTMFIFQNNGYPEFKLDGINAQYYIPKTNVSKFDISIELIPNIENSLDLYVEYCTELFDKEFTKGFAEHYVKILTEISNTPNVQISKINVLNENEIKILEEFNSTEEEYSKDKTVIKIFEENVIKNPNKIAIIFKNQKITYKELNERANELANYLLENNIKPKNVIGILLSRTENVIVSMLATSKVGCAYMLIDSNLPNDRINYMLTNSNAEALITEENVKYIEFKTKIFIENVKNMSKENINIQNNIEDAFSIIYTSGSTGKPKGVLLQNKGVINLVLSYQKILNTNICDNFLSMSTVSFDMFMVETMVPLLSGKTIILTTEEEQKIPVYTSKLILKHKVDFMLTTPSRIELFLNNKLYECLENMKIIQLGGEVFTLELKDRLKERTRANLYNGYGPTEITACCSTKMVEDYVSLGKPLCNTQIYILNEENNICPINVPGEICITGDGVSLGYVNNEELTKNVFIKNPYGKGYMYKTGDIGRINSNGELKYIDRKDSQIKIRGLRVELSEIEKQILNAIKLKSCTVIYKKDKGYISAFISADKKIDSREAKRKLEQKLPLYMVPKYIIQLDELPLTRNGKINKKVLEKYDDEVSEDVAYVEPKTEKEKLFCSIWEKLLNKKVGIDNDVFECGADSLIAIKFKTELLANNIEIPYSDLFKYKTVRSFCKNSTIKEADDNDRYDYTNINKIIEKNNIKNLGKIITKTNNNVLLFGATGFVGMHIIKDFIINDQGTIYCIVRDKNNKSAVERFIDILHFYFGDKLDKYLGTRIIVVKGNVLKENFELSNKNYRNLKDNIDIVINSVAIVKHYGDEKKFIETNVGSTQNIINFCIEKNKRLLQISSLSVSGNASLDGNADDRILEEKASFSETDFYKEQNLSNVYLNSKFKSERLILENIEKGLKAQILRLGNITNRFSDGIFQINPEDNAFACKMRSFIKLGIIPKYLLNDYVEFTPVDLCAKAIIKIMQNYEKNFSVYHVYNNEHVYFYELQEYLKKNNINLKIVSHEEFKEKVENTLKEKNVNILSGIINDFDKEKKLIYSSNIEIMSEFTRAFLYKIGFIWPKIDEHYMKKYLEHLTKIKFL